MAQFLKSCAPSKPIPFQIVNRDPTAKDHFSDILGAKTYEYLQKDPSIHAIPRFVADSLAQTKEDREHILKMTEWTTPSSEDPEH